MKRLNLGIDILGIHNRTAAEDPLKIFNFLVEIDGFARFGFAKCSKLSMDFDVAEYREGGDNTTAQKSPGQVKFTEITLTRGQILAAGKGSEDMLNWLNQVFNIASKGPSGSAVFRRTVEIVQTGNDGSPKLRWRVRQAWPKGHSPFDDLDALGQANSMETMILVNEGYGLVK